MPSQSPTLSVVASLAVALVACASGGHSGPFDTVRTHDGAPIGNRDETGLAVRPFTAEQIAAAMPVGSWRRYLMEQLGELSFEQLGTVVKREGKSVTFENRIFELDGSPRGEPAAMTADWVELRNHATWPSEATVIHHTRLELPSGSFDCWRYTVRSEEGGVPMVSRFYFAKDRPGPPVRYDLVRDGLRVFRMTLLDSGAG